jgi:hypothetical protein
MALSIGEMDSLMNSLSTDPFIALCGFSPSSKTLYSCSCLCTMNANLLPESNHGSFWSATLKACATLSKVALSDSNFGFVELLMLNQPSRMA